MRLPDESHLTYCTNIHAAEHWPDVLAGLREHLPPIKRAVSPDRPMGIGLRIAASAARALSEPVHWREMADFLATDNYYIFTINGFPYGQFHGQPVKEEAYRPDWSQSERLQYTNTLASLLARWLPEGVVGSVSTVPGTFKPWADATRVATIARQLIDHAVYLFELEQHSGKQIVLALEPEPYCLLETIAETIDFFEQHLYGGAAVQYFMQQTGTTPANAESALRRYLGVCYDVCHAAVEFEDPQHSIGALRAAGIAIAKLQLSSAMRIARVDASTPAILTPFDEPVYLHQVVQQRAGELTRYIDLDTALAAVDTAMGSEWRVHFHVPIFLADMDRVGTTQAFLQTILRDHRTAPISAHLEVETYSFGALPAAHRPPSMSAAIARELNWVKSELAA